MTTDSEHTATVADGLLESFLAADRREALACGGDLPERMQGAGLFADISGFTPLTEALAAALGPQRGAEELTYNLNRVYQAIIDDLGQRGGVVLYFSGDAITCWLDGDDGSRAAACALAMQQTILDAGRVTTPTGDVVELSIKVAVAVGEAHRFPVGDPSIQRLDVLAGALIDQLAAAEQLADRGDVMLDQSAIDALGTAAQLSETRTDPATGRSCGVLRSLTVAPPAAGIETVRPTLPSETVAPWLLDGVFRRLSAGAGDFFAELRTAYPIFIRFGGFDYDHDDAVATLDDFVVQVQRVLARYDGDLMVLTVGDKGAYIFAVLGALVSHEDDAHRAAAAALDISQLSNSTAATDIQVGVASGRVYTGTYGHTERRTYTCLGDPVNLAARLMGSAGLGEIYVSEDVAATIDDRFFWTELPPLELKGKAEPVAARALDGRRRTAVRRHLRYPLPMVGRDRELAIVADRLEHAEQGAAQLVGLSADAGIGKSRFVAEILQHADRDGLAVAYGEAEALGTTTPYLVWRGITRTLFDIDDDAPDPEQRRRVEQVLTAVDPALLTRAPLLGTVLGVHIPDNEVTTHFDAKLRRTSLQNLLADLLKVRLSVSPLLVVLEDCHWIDPSSADLLEALVRTSADLPVTFLAAYRNVPGNDIGTRLAAMPGFTEVALRELDSLGIGAVIDAKVAQVFGTEATPSPGLLALIHERAGGNPFYVEEIVNYVKRRDLDPASEDIQDHLDLPNSIEAIVRSRVDALSERPRQALKVASVIGHEFDADVLPLVRDLGPTEVLDHLRDLQRADLVVPYDVGEQTWRFRHAITREVAYESIPFALRSPLHESVGTVIEASDPEGIEFNLDVLAHHFWHSDNVDKKRTYVARAGEAARAAYANENAIVQFRRLTTIVDDGERAGPLLDLARVLALIGDWDEAEAAAADARVLAAGSGDADATGWSDVELGELARKRGRFDDATALLTDARQQFDDAGDAAGEARVLHLLGTVSAQQGDLVAARAAYSASLVLRQELADRGGLADILTNLGIVAEYEGDYAESERFHERAAELRRQTGDKCALVNSYTNLGMIAYLQDRFAEARVLFDNAMRLATEVGDDWMVALAHNNLANATRGLGDHDASRRHFAASLEAYRSFDDRWALALLFEDLATLAAVDGDPAGALEFVGAADRLRTEIDAPAPESARAELKTRIDAAARSLDDVAQSTHRQIGADRKTDTAIDHALQFCGQHRA